MKILIWYWEAIRNSWIRGSLMGLQWVCVPLSGYMLWQRFVNWSFGYFYSRQRGFRSVWSWNLVKRYPFSTPLVYILCMEILCRIRSALKSLKKCVRPSVLCIVLIITITTGELRAKAMTRKIGVTSVPLIGSPNLIRSVETNLGNIITDIMRFTLKTSFGTSKITIALSGIDKTMQLLSIQEQSD